VKRASRRAHIPAGILLTMRLASVPSHFMARAVIHVGSGGFAILRFPSKVGRSQEPFIRISLAVMKFLDSI